MLEDQRDLDPSTPYLALPLFNLTEQNAWRADSQEGLTIAVSLALRLQSTCQKN
jgi:hypothetical protein